MSLMINSFYGIKQSNEEWLPKLGSISSLQYFHLANAKYKIKEIEKKLSYLHKFSLISYNIVSMVYASNLFIFISYMFTHWNLINCKTQIYGIVYNLMGLILVFVSFNVNIYRITILCYIQLIFIWFIAVSNLITTILLVFLVFFIKESYLHRKKRKFLLDLSQTEFYISTGYLILNLSNLVIGHYQLCLIRQLKKLKLNENHIFKSIQCCSSSNEGEDQNKDEEAPEDNNLKTKIKQLFQKKVVKQKARKSEKEIEEELINKQSILKSWHEHLKKSKSRLTIKLRHN